MNDPQKSLHDDFCILVIFLILLAIGMMVGLFLLSFKEYGSAVRQGLDTYNQIGLK